MTTATKPYFYRVFWPFPFFSNIKKAKTKNAIFFSKTSFLTSPKFFTNTVLAQCDTICVFKNTQKHYKKGGETVKTNLDQFLTLNLDQFLTLKPPNLGSVFNFTAHIYIYIYICAVGSITWPHLGILRVNNLATNKSITWPPFLVYKLSVFWEFFVSAQFSGGGAKSVFRKAVFGQKWGFPKMGGALFWGVEGLVYFCCMMLQDALEGC